MMNIKPKCAVEFMWNRKKVWPSVPESISVGERHKNDNDNCLTSPANNVNRKFLIFFFPYSSLFNIFTPLNFNMIIEHTCTKCYPLGPLLGELFTQFAVVKQSS